MQSSVTRLPGSSLMCCHKASSWQRLSAAAQSGPGVALFIVSDCRPDCTPFHFTTQLKIWKNKRSKKKRKKENFLCCHLNILGRWRKRGSFGSALCHEFFRLQAGIWFTSLLNGQRSSASCHVVKPFTVQSCGFQNPLQVQTWFVLVEGLQTNSCSPSESAVVLIYKVLILYAAVCIKAVLRVI